MPARDHDTFAITRERNRVTTTSAAPPTTPDDDLALADRLSDVRGRILHELHKVIIGQDAVIEQVLLTLFAGGHSLIIGVPGLAKTLLVQTVARTLDLKFSRIQFTPDLMPSDITGTDLVQEDPATGRRELTFMPGPVFGNIVLADEVNRTPPKTQAALLEAMQEHRVTVQGRTYELPEPFFVFATQNPIELEGTYPLPEAQLDRFQFNIVIEYGDEDEEVAIVQGTTGTAPEAVGRWSTVRSCGPSRSWCAACRWPTKSCATRCSWCAPAGPTAAPRPTTSSAG